MRRRRGILRGSGHMSHQLKRPHVSVPYNNRPCHHESLGTESWTVGRPTVPTVSPYGLSGRRSTFSPATPPPPPPWGTPTPVGLQSPRSTVPPRGEAPRYRGVGHRQRELPLRRRQVGLEEDPVPLLHRQTRGCLGRATTRRPPQPRRQWDPRRSKARFLSSAPIHPSVGRNAAPGLDGWAGYGSAPDRSSASARACCAPAGGPARSAGTGPAA